MRSRAQRAGTHDIDVSLPHDLAFLFSGRRAVRRSVAVAAVAAILVLGGCSGEAPQPAPGTEPGRDGFAVLVFTRTIGFRQTSIDDGVAAMRRLGTANGFTVDVTQDPERIQDATLKGLPRRGVPIVDRGSP